MSWLPDMDVAFQLCAECGCTYRFDIAADQLQCPLCGHAPVEDVE